MSPIDAARLVVRDYPGGATSLAPRLGKAASSLSHEVDPNFRGAKLGLMDAVTISAMAGDRRILNAFADEMGCMVLPLPRSEQPQGCTLTALAEKSKRSSAYMAEVASALADGVVTPNELDRINAAYAELVVSLQHMQAHISAINAAAKREPVTA